MNRPCRLLGAALVALALLPAMPPARRATALAAQELTLYAQRGPGPGATAPDLVLPWATRDTVGSADFPFTLWKARGQLVVLHFTGSLADSAARALLRVLDAEREALPPGSVLAVVSTDGPAALREAARAADVPILLLADTAQLAAGRYGAARRKGENRSVLFLVGPDGSVAWRADNFAARPAELAAFRRAAGRARGF
ncbi:MAG: redoxin domain-containing protein [Gemmatimonadales bacterium]|nr:redoxin domain-containing protein [Gemmatimonadales bacterium]